MANKTTQIIDHNSDQYIYIYIGTPEDFHHQMMALLIAFLSLEKLRILDHSYDTILNEALTII